MNVNLSGHANTRAQQRNLAPDEIEFIIRHARRVHKTGVIFCQMLRKCLPDDLPANHRYRRLVGSTVVLCNCGQSVITVYREERAFKRDRRKSKYKQKEVLHCCIDCEAAA